MPAYSYQNDDKKTAHGYRQIWAHYWTCTDEGLNAAREIRRRAGQENQQWLALTPELGKFAKEQMKAAQRLEKAATIWLRHFEQVGRKSIRNMPSELAEELDFVWREMENA